MTEIIRQEDVDLRVTPEPPRALSELKTLLIEGEEVRAYALQHRLYALIHRRHIAAATTGRFIYLSRPLIGGYDPVDVRWQDLKEAKLTVGLFTATITLTYSANHSDTASGEGEVKVLRAGGLTIEAAQGLYRACQTQEQAWREKRRIRSMEEMRAASGAVQMATVYPQADLMKHIDASEPVGSSVESPVERLKRAKDMLDQGLLTDAEYEAIKARIVSAL